MSSKVSQGQYLTVLTHSPPHDVKQLAEHVLDSIGNVIVIKNQTGLAMVPYIDSANGTVFHLGEVLIAEAHVRLSDDTEGYGMVMGRDNTFALAVAILDASMQQQHMVDEIRAFVTQQEAIQKQDDSDLLRKVEATRVEMETF